MFKLAEVAIAAIASFVATTLDDIIVMMVFFAQVNNPSLSSHLKRRHIVIGQYLGFFSLIIASLPGFFGGLIIEKKWIGILGFIPIVIGIKQLINNLQHQSDENEIQGVSVQLNSVIDDDTNQTSPKIGERSLMSLFAIMISPQTYKVATVAFANGGDNIGIYVPLFASSNIIELVMTLGIFFVMLGMWIYIANQLSQHPAIAPILSRRGHQIIPFVLIALGIFILTESETYKLIFPA